MAEDLNSAIQTGATQPKRGKGDGIEFEQRGLDELIKADKHLGAKAALSGKRPKLMVNRMVPPGAS